MQYQKCIYCSKQTKVSRKGNLLSHLGGSVQCVGTGHPAAQMAAFLELRKTAR